MKPSKKAREEVKAIKNKIKAAKKAAKKIKDFTNKVQ